MVRLSLVHDLNEVLEENWATTRPGDDPSSLRMVMAGEYVPGFSPAQPANAKAMSARTPIRADTATPRRAGFLFSLGATRLHLVVLRAAGALYEGLLSIGVEEDAETCLARGTRHLRRAHALAWIEVLVPPACLKAGQERIGGGRCRRGENGWLGGAFDHDLFRRRSGDRRGIFPSEGVEYHRSRNEEREPELVLTHFVHPLELQSALRVV